MAARTRLSLDGYGAKRAGSFASKSSSGQTVPAVTLAGRERHMTIRARVRTYLFPARSKR